MRTDTEFLFEIGAMPPADDVDFEKFWTAFCNEASHSRGQRSAARNSFRSDIFDTHKTSFEAMELLHETAEEAINWASEVVHEALSDDAEDDAFAEYFNTLVGLSGRALLAFDELTWLLRGGYPSGAWTRVRSIQELFIVVATLGLYGSPSGTHPDLVERYLKHHEVFTRATADDLLATEIDDVDETIDAQVLHALTQKRADLIATHGRDFAGAWGWAAPLFPQSRPTFTALSKLIVPSFNLFYGIASTHIHASSQGLVEATGETGDGQPYFQAGPQEDGLELPAHLGSAFLVGVLGAIVPVSIGRPDVVDPNKDGYYFLSAISRIRDQIVNGM